MKFHRMVSILLTIENKGKVTAQELADKLEVSKRTVYRDIDALCESGIPVVCESGPNGGVSLMEGYQAEIKNMEKEDIIYLYLSGMGIKADGSSEMSVKSGISMQKLEKILKKDGVDTDLLKNRFYIDKSPWWEKRKKLNHIDSIIKAIWESRKLIISYEKMNGELSERMIRPYGLAVKDTQWYLVSYCERSKSLRIFKCERIEECELTCMNFIIPEAFSLKNYFQTSIMEFETRCREKERYPVILRISGEKLDLLNNCEIISTRKCDDELEITVNLYTYNRALSEFWNILLASCVIEPAELRDKVSEILRSAVRRYSH